MVTYKSFTRGGQQVKLVREKEASYSKMKIPDSRAVFELFKDLKNERQEKFFVVCVNAKNEVVGMENTFTGTMTSSLVHPREVFQFALLSGAASVFFVHNHPSGDPAASTEDYAITVRLKEVGELIGISVLDHVIIGDGRFVSFRDHGLIEW